MEENIYRIAKTFAAFENNCSLNTFLNVFFYDNHRAHDIYNFYAKNKLAQAINYKMSQYERDLISKFLNEMYELNDYSKMCDFVTEFSSQLKTA